MTGVYFTKAEADAKTGKKIRSRWAFSGVPLGTMGKVTGKYESGETNQFGLDITWDLPYTYKPLVDGFSKDEYDEFLEEITETQPGNQSNSAYAQKEIDQNVKIKQIIEAIRKDIAEEETRIAASRK